MGLVILLAGCTPTAHSLSPYRDDPKQARELEERAFEFCWEHRGTSVMPEYTFTTDGCSSWPDGPWVECCVTHDFAYWCGGSAEDRRAADRELRRCVSEASSGCMGGMMYLGVRVGGTPWSPFPWRWAYGWSGVRGYESLE